MITAVETPTTKPFSLTTKNVSESFLEELSLRSVSRQVPRKTIAVRAPFTGELIGQITDSTADDVAEAVRRSRSAQAEWQKTDPERRASIFLKFHDLIRDEQETLLDLMQIESGKARRDAFEEILDVMNVTRYYAYRISDFLKPKSRSGAIPVLTQVTEYKHPLGLVAIISPWNYPLSMAITDAVPAILAGNTVILKPAEQTSFTALFVESILRKAGLPLDVFQIVTGTGPVLGPELIHRADFLHFTGSTKTGRVVARQAGEALIKCSLELGGKNPMIVLENVDIQAAAAGAVRGSFTNAGQLCISFERIYVHRSRLNEFLQAFARRTKRIRLGSEFSHEVQMGSLVSGEHFKKVVDHIEDAVSKGARVVCGGKSRPDVGPYFVEPTILTDVPEDADLYREETFGPVVSVIPFDTEEEAIAFANDSEYGLNASVWSRDTTRAERVARQIRCGTVNINDAYAPSWGSVDAPMGGMKSSGVGRRHGREGLLKYTESQTIATQRLVPIAPPEIIPIETYHSIMSRLIGWMRHIPGIR